MQKKAFADRFKEAVKYSGVEDTQDALGRLLGVSSVMIWSYKTGEKMPRMATAMRMAEKLGVNVNWLLSGTGSMAADSQSNTEPSLITLGKVPLISSVQAGHWCEAVDNFHPGDAEEWLPAPSKHSKHAYALRVTGSSMEPRFREGEIVVIDPEIEATSGRFVVAKKTGNQEVTLKQLVIEGGERYLKALNPHWPEPIIRMTEDWHICGSVICKIELF